MNVTTLAITPVSPPTSKAIAASVATPTAATPLDSMTWSSHGEENYNTPQGVFNDFPGRKGYDPNFLGVNLPLPQLDDSIRQTAAQLLSDPTQIELKYNHFSVVQNKERATPMMTSVNIDGEQFQDLERKGTWVFDGRIAREYQMGKAAYSDNDFDRGHLVRRKDAQWGPDAAGGSNDTFVYTNCGLQHSYLNQKTWLDVENSVLYGAVATKEKKTVFSGPVLCEDDPVFDNGGKLELPTKIPQAFWKVEVWKDPSEGLQAEAFVISQKELIGQPGSKIPYEHMTPMQLQTHRVTMEQLEEMTHIHFGGLPDGKDRTASDQAAIVAAGIDLSEHPWTKEKPAA
jgi:endonuclease G, mitochondrial